MKTLHAEAEQKLLGIIIDMDLNFQSHKKSIIKTASQKLSVIIIKLSVNDWLVIERAVQLLFLRLEN